MKEKITLSLDQHENARHGEEIFPLQKYVTSLWKEYPYVTAHWHEEAEFTRIEKGSCTYQIHLETYEVEEGDLIFIPPAVLHAISNEKEERMQSETYVFHMDFLGAKAADICAIRYLNPLMNQKLIPPFVIKKGHPLYEKAAELFENINAEYDKKTPGYEIGIKSYLLQLVAALIPYCTRNTEADAILTEHAKKLKEVLSYIDAHYMEELTISGLAGICFFSEYYFMRFFKKYMGMSCVQYIKNVRLERAADQFENGETNTLEVALACGFSNLSYFHREFKKKYGMTPKRFISLSARAADFHEGVNNYHFYDS